SSLLAYGSKSSAATPLRAILLHFPRGSRSRSPRDDLEIGLPDSPLLLRRVTGLGITADFEQGPQALDSRLWPLGKVGQGAVAHFAGVAEGFAQKDAGRGVAVAD
ncbi:MAG: hypothetical protein WC076_13965, partial [Terrimicrobiaceae bacterium]